MSEVGGDLCFDGDPHEIEIFAQPIIRLVHDRGLYAGTVARIKASRLRTWAEAANEVAAAVSCSARGGIGGPGQRRDAAPKRHPPRGRVAAPA